MDIFSDSSSSTLFGPPSHQTSALADADNEKSQDLKVTAAVRYHWRSVRWILALFPAIVLLGYDGVIVNNLTAMPVFQ